MKHNLLKFGAIGLALTAAIPILANQANGPNKASPVTTEEVQRMATEHIELAASQVLTIAIVQHDVAIIITDASAFTINHCTIAPIAITATTACDTEARCPAGATIVSAVSCQEIADVRQGSGWTTVAATHAAPTQGKGCFGAELATVVANGVSADVGFADGSQNAI